MHRLLAIALLAFLAVRAPAFASNELQLELSLSPAGHLQTQIVINEGEPDYAVLDTGANIALIDKAVASRNGVLIPPETSPQVEVLGLTGHALHPLVHIESVQVGSKGLQNLRAALRLETRSIDHGAIIPMTAFQQRYVDINPPERTLTFRERRPRLRREDRRSFPLREVQGLYFVEIQLNGVSGLALIDTGSNATLISSQFAQSARGSNIPSTVEVIGVHGEPKPAEYMRVRRMHLGKYRLRGFELVVFDPPVFEHLGFGDQPMMVLGTDLLRYFRVVIDREDERVWFVGPKAPRLSLGARTSRLNE